MTNLDSLRKCEAGFSEP